MRMADDAERREARERHRAAATTAHVIRVFDDPAEIDAASWDALLAAQPSATPFVSIDYLRALHESASAVADTGWAPHFLAPRAGRRAASPRVRSTSRTTRTASTCSTGPGPTPTGATASTTTRSCSARSRSRRCPGRACWRTHARAPPAPAARDRAARARRPGSRRRTCSSSTTPTRRRRARRAGRCARTVQFHWTQPRARRPTPTSPTSSPACSATSARRSSRSGAASPTPASPSRSRPARAIARRRLGLLLPLLHPHLPRASLDALPDARLLRPRRRRRWREHWLLFTAWRGGERDRRVADRDRPGAQGRLRPLLGRGRARHLPALRRLLLPAARLVHRQRLPALRGRRAGRAQDGARPAAGADLVGALAGAPAVRARGRRLPRPRGRRHRRSTSTSSTSGARSRRRRRGALSAAG